MLKYYYNDELLNGFHNNIHMQMLISGKEGYHFYLLKTINHTVGQSAHILLCTQHELYAVQHPTIESIVMLYSAEDGETVSYGSNDEMISFDESTGNAVANQQVTFAKFRDTSDGVDYEIELLWSNTDIYKMTLDYEITDELYLSASEPIMYILSPFYYNGIRLPKLPTNPSSDYTYSIVIKADVAFDSIYMCALLKEKVVVNQDETMLFATQTPYLTYQVGESGSWELIGETSENPIMELGATDGGDVYTSLVWSNHNILYEDSDDIYLKASESIDENKEYSISATRIIQFANLLRNKDERHKPITLDDMLISLKKLTQ